MPAGVSPRRVGGGTGDRSRRWLPAEKRPILQSRDGRATPTATLATTTPTVAVPLATTAFAADPTRKAPDG